MNQITKNLNKYVRCCDFIPIAFNVDTKKNAYKNYIYDLLVRINRDVLTEKQNLELAYVMAYSLQLDYDVLREKHLIGIIQLIISRFEQLFAPDYELEFLYLQIIYLLHRNTMVSYDLKILSVVTKLLNSLDEEYNVKVLEFVTSQLDISFSKDVMANLVSEIHIVINRLIGAPLDALDSQLLLCESLTNVERYE